MSQDQSPSHSEPWKHSHSLQESEYVQASSNVSSLFTDYESWKANIHIFHLNCSHSYNQDNSESPKTKRNCVYSSWPVTDEHKLVCFPSHALEEGTIYNITLSTTDKEKYPPRNSDSNTLQRKIKGEPEMISMDLKSDPSILGCATSTLYASASSSVRNPLQAPRNPQTLILHTSICSSFPKQQFGRL